MCNNKASYKRKKGDNNEVNIMHLCRDCHDIQDFIIGKRKKIFRPQYEFSLRCIYQKYQRLQRINEQTKK
jgi:hypothetical protein